MKPDYGDYLYKNITTNSSTIITGSLILIAIVINTKGAASNTAKIYNSTTVDSQAVVGTIDTTVVPGPFVYNLPCPNGILVVTATGTAPDLTVIYKPV